MRRLKVEYEFYANEYEGGAIPPSEWDEYALRAANHLARIEAQYRVTPYALDSREMAVCAMAEELRDYDVAASDNVASTSIGSVSVSYDATRGGSLDLTPQGKERALLRAARTYLSVYGGLG